MLILIRVYAEMRSKKDKVEEQIKNHCFICGIDRDTFDFHGFGEYSCNARALYRIRISLCVSHRFFGCACRLRCTLCVSGCSGYRNHVYNDHFMWNYIYLRKYLRDKPPTELTGQEQYLHNMYETRNIAFLPVRRALCLVERRRLENQMHPGHGGSSKSANKVNA